MAEEKEILTPEEIEQIIRKLEVDYPELVNSGQHVMIVDCIEAVR